MAPPAVTITFEGRPLTCRPGQSVAAALWDNGVKVLSHSPKYGRPRGATCARGHCTGCLMRIDGVPNVRACATEVREGLAVARQDAGAGYGRPLQAALESGGGLLPVGFYYKWFTRPAILSRLFMAAIRPLTGIGRLPDASAWRDGTSPQAARDRGTWDTIVVGGGAAGLDAASGAGGRVLLIDDHDGPGGQRRPALARAASDAPDALAAFPELVSLRDALESGRERFAAAADATFAAATTVVGAYQPDTLLLRDRDGLSVARGRRIVWAAGALDTIGMFDDADLPGIVGPRALYRLVCRDGLDAGGRAAVVWGGGIDLWLSAALLHAAGARVALALAPDAAVDGDALAAARRLGWTLHTDLTPAAARAEAGALAALRLSGAGGSRTAIPCELAVMCGRGKPAYDVAFQLGCDLVLDPSRGGFVPRDADAGGWSGRTRGGLDLAVVGEAAGLPPAAALREANA